MSDAQPIDPARFAEALESLPVDALFSKAAELTNSIAHLHDSNQQMLPFAEEGDQDCKEAMFENLGVIGRMNERIALIKNEVQTRGLLWPSEDSAEDKSEQGKDVNMTNGEGELVNGHAHSSSTDRPVQSGSLTDAQLQQRLQDILPDDDDDEEEGIHI